MTYVICRMYQVLGIYNYFLVHFLYRLIGLLLETVFVVRPNTITNYCTCRLFVDGRKQFANFYGQMGSFCNPGFSRSLKPLEVRILELFRVRISLDYYFNFFQSGLKKSRDNCPWNVFKFEVPNPRIFETIFFVEKQ